MTEVPHILIAGGGATGTILSAQLLRRGARVSLVERNTVGEGVAYSTRDPAHLLNTRSAAMSAFPDIPGDFVDWLLRDRGEADPAVFESRADYARYLKHLLAPWQGHPRLRILRDEAVAVDDRGTSVTLHCAGGEVLAGDRLVLATGHAVPEAEPGMRQPWREGGTPDGLVLLVGTGLTMVDEVLSLLEAGHRGGMLAISRRGLLPRHHLEEPPRPVILPDDVPVGEGPATIARWLRRTVAREVASGGDWRGVVDAVRPEVQTLWRAMPGAGRRVFLRHGAVWWDVHRHRMPPGSRARLDAAMADGSFRLQRARLQGLADGTARLCLPGGGVEDVATAAVIDCRGIRRDPERSASPLIAGLLGSGMARIDPLRLGLDVTPQGAIIARDGTVSQTIHAAGPPSRAALWEITAIPDIREQVARLAASFVPGCE
ncbi:FAD/NAD(P)-binding protein [Haematobacter massiliensis]|mgnify:CR=1 FL=1|uniref:FAD/NAD(P)-binding protein n=1 Tax=Haematobacter massiliensis TaxID=195105 RepID=UPI0023F3C2AD|nr:FAD/NAD(P)-binding protein [Haematobacter massiliensis]